MCLIERILETDEEVDFLPRKPPVAAEERRHEADRGVTGAGDRETRFRGVVTGAGFGAGGCWGRCF